LIRLRTRLAAIAFAVIAPATITACGGSSAPNFDPQKVVHQTFSNPKSIDSGNVDISLSAQGPTGSFDAAISGPFQGSKNPTQFPQFDLTGKLSGSGAGTPSISFEGGLTVTKDAAFVSYQGTAYQVPSALFDRLKALYGLAARQGGGSSASTNASSFFKRVGIDPAKWLTNVQAAGTSDIGGVTTDHVSGDADIPKVAHDLGKIARAVNGGQVSASGINRLQQVLKSANLDLYSGADDKLLRKLSISLQIAQGSQSGTVDFSITLTHVNEPQTISPPPNPQPIPRSFLNRIRALSATGAL
jgi:hypothetical protein